MKRFLLIALSILAISALPGHAQRNFGLGFIAGEPTGLSGKLWLGKENALDMSLGFSVREDWINGGVDYVWHNYNLIPVPRGQFPIYYGMGVLLALGNDYVALGPRGVFGLEYLFPDAPLDLFVEIGPGAWIIPDTHLNLSGGLGMRYFF